MFKKLKGAFKAMKEKTTETINTVKNMVADPRNRFVTGFVLGSLSLGLMGSALIQMKGII